VLYVAVTRAERRLHLLGVANRDLKSENSNALKAPAATSLLAPLWPALENTFLEAVAQSSDTATPVKKFDSAGFVPRLIRLRSDYLNEHAPTDTTTESFSGHDQTYDSNYQTIDMAIGTLTHRYLEAIANDGLTSWSSERIALLLPRFEQYFAHEGYESTACSDAAKLVQEALQGALDSKDGRWLLGPHEAAGCEVPMSSLQPDDPDRFSHHVIDRTFIHAGERWVIDYKTLGLIESQESIEQRLQSKALTYQPQLERYAALFANEGLNVRTAIFFPTHGKLIEV
jgi:ATP-dependent exoDNAse (exonuclease V) beta subunit